MKKEIKCELCGKRYMPKDNFNPAFAFVWCPQCLDEYKKETSDRFKNAIKKHLESDFNNEYEAQKWVWQTFILSNNQH